MEYTGKLYGRIGKKYFYTGKTGEDYDNNAIKFARFILKYCEEKQDAGIIYWRYENKDYDTEELYQVFRNQL